MELSCVDVFLRLVLNDASNLVTNGILSQPLPDITSVIIIKRVVLYTFVK